MKYLVYTSILFCPLLSFANDGNSRCTKFTGDGAKITFLELYPFTQGRATAIGAERVGSDLIKIKSLSILCQVKTKKVVPYKQSEEEALAILRKIDSAKFKCGYEISSEGNLSSCKSI